MSDPKQTVIDFCAAWDARDEQRIVDAFTDDGVYHNMPMAAVKGKDAIKGLLGVILAPASSVKFEIKHIAAEGDVVLTERLDTFLMGGKTVTLDVMGVFEVRDGKIAAWRDYFDMAAWTRQAG
jgi:limonene-1,2-epoxide hydrolase